MIFCRRSKHPPVLINTNNAFAYSAKPLFRATRFLRKLCAGIFSRFPDSRIITWVEPSHACAQWRPSTPLPAHSDRIVRVFHPIPFYPRQHQTHRAALKSLFCSCRLYRCFTFPSIKSSASFVIQTPRLSVDGFTGKGMNACFYVFSSKTYRRRWDKWQVKWIKNWPVRTKR